MPRILNNLRYSARSFLRTPGLTLTLLFTIAIGVGSNVSIYGFVRGFTAPALPLVTTSRIVSLFEQDARREADPLSPREYLSAKERSDVFEWVSAARISQRSIKIAGQTAIVPVAAVAPDLTKLFGLQLEQGAVISHRVWRSEFGAKEKICGEEIQIDGVTVRIIGIAPEWLEGIYRDRTVDLWLPLQEEDLRGTEDNRGLWVLGRLHQNISAGQAQLAVHPKQDSGGLRVVPYTGITPEMAATLSRVSTLLRFAAGVVFFIACANVALFLLGRAFTRFRETALRVAIGAGRGQLIGELLSDSIVIAVIGGASGALLAVWMLRMIPALLYEEDATRLVFAPDLTSIGVASVACIGIVILCGLLPVLIIPHDRPVTILRRDSNGASPAIRHLRLALVVAQMAGCCVLVISTAFLFQGLRAALVTGAGQRLNHTILATVQAHPEAGIHYFRKVEETTKLLPGVVGMSWTSRLPGNQSTWQSFRIEPAHLPFREIALDVDWFTADSMKLFAFPPKAGHMFGLAEQTCQAAIVNEEAADKLFGEYTAGRTIQNVANAQPGEIVGVAAMRQAEGRAKKNRPTIYFNYTNRNEPAPRRMMDARFRAPIDSELALGELEVNVVSPEYFSAMGAKLITGHGFTGNHKTTACRVGLVNREAADLYFEGKAIGAAVIDGQHRRTEIIGVVHSEPLGIFQRHTEPALYLPMSQDTLPRMTMMIQVREVNDSLLAELHRRLDAVPGHGPAPIVIKTFDTYLTQTSLAPLRIASIILGATATMALLLSILGLLGALSDTARQRHRELAIRIALGSQRWRVIAQVMREGIRLASAGALLGIFVSLALSRWIAGLTPRSGMPELWVWLTPPIVLAAAVAIAGFLPAREALMVNPLAAMREE